MVGIAIHQSKALFKGYCRPSENFNFIKGTLYNIKKEPASERLGNSRWSAQFYMRQFSCDRVILDDAIICMDKHTTISYFFNFRPHKTYSRIKVSLLP